MPFPPQLPASRSRTIPTAPFQLASHTPAANALTKKLYQGKISQEDYDAQIFSTCITSADSIKTIPIILTLDDNLSELLAHANLALGTPAARAQTTKMHVMWRVKKVYVAGADLLSENTDRLVQNRLKMTLEFMKAERAGQLLLEYEEGVAEATDKRVVTFAEETQSESEDDTPMVITSPSPPARDQSGAEGEEQADSGKGKERDLAPSTQHEALELVVARDKSLVRLIQAGITEASRGGESERQQEARREKEKRKSGWRV